MTTLARRLGTTAICGALFAQALASSAAAADAIEVGAKKFTESVVLARLLVEAAEDAGSAVEYRGELGGTRILWDALVAGEIDAYPEYTGTLRREILGWTDEDDGKDLDAALASFGVSMTRSLGFENTYALGMRREQASRLGVRDLSDLHRHQSLRFAFTNEFIDRSDGWPAVRLAYDLFEVRARGLDHDLAYRALASGGIDVTDFYSTDAEITAYDFVVLRDDRRLFPEYRAVVLYRSELRETAPAVVAAWTGLEGTLSAAAMTAMNAAVKLDGEPEAAVAASFLARTLGRVPRAGPPQGVAARVARRTVEHLRLVGISLSAAIVVALPLGILAAKRARAGQAILAAVGVVQTVPSLALLVFMIPLLGIGGPPAIAALFLYSLLPIVRTTHSGLTSIPAPLADSARVLGLRPGERLRWVEIPLATPSILAGIKTSAVINVGTATLGALIGAGGYGQPILTGIRLNDTARILEGAVPAAVLALGVQALFDRFERRLRPSGFRTDGS